MNTSKIIQDGINIQNTGNVSTFLSLQFIKTEGMSFVYKLVFPRECSNPFGYVQGGMITAALDETTSLTAVIASKNKFIPNSTDIHITFHRPVLIGEATAVAKIIKLGRNIVSIEGKLYSSNNKLSASLLHTALLQPK